MGQPWGLSGPQFLALYAAGFLAALVLMIVVRAVLVRVGSGGAGSDVRLDVYEAAYLAGGWRRVVDTAIAALALRDRVLVGRGGRLTPVAGAIGQGPVESAVCGALTHSMSKAALYRRMRHHPAVRAVGEHVRSRGLLLDGPAAALWRLVGLLPVGVWIVGLVRAVNGVKLHRPTGNLEALLVLTFLVLIFVVIRLFARRRPSATGRAALRALRREHRTWSRDGLGVEHQLAGVALLGFAAISDPTLRWALVGTSSSSGGGDSGGSSCGSSSCGSSCGGGGCGG